MRRSTRAAFVLMAAVLTTSFGFMRAAAGQELAQADCAELDGQAASLCRSALQDDAAAVVLLRLGKLLREQRAFELATKVFARGTRLHPGNADLRARYRMTKSEWEEAERMQEKEDTGETQVKAKASLCKRMATSVPSAALDACEEALAAMPGDAALLEAKGHALEGLEQYAQAYQAFAAAAQRAPSDELNDKLAALSEYAPEPEPEPEEIAKAETEPDTESDPASMDEQPAEDNGKNEADERASLASVADDPEKPLKERLKARNMLFNMAAQSGG